MVSGGPAQRREDGQAFILWGGLSDMAHCMAKKGW